MDSSQFNPRHLNPFAPSVTQQNTDVPVGQQADDASLQASFEEHVSGLQHGTGSGRRRRGYSQAFGEDVALIREAKRATLDKGVPARSVANAGTDVQNLSIWLRQDNRGQIAGRLGQDSLVADVRDYINNGGGPRSVVSSVNKLMPGTLPTLDEVLGRAPRALEPYPADARLINGAVWHAAGDVGASTGEQRRPIHMRATRLRALSDWLKKENRGSIVGRLNGNQPQQDAFQEDVTVFRGSGRNRTLMDADLAILRNYLQAVEADQVLGLQGREQPGFPSMEGVRTFVGAPSPDIYS